MNSNAVDALTRRSGAVSRRGSLRLLGGAALASAIPALGVAKAGKKSRKRCQKRADPCQGQLEQCRSHFEVICEGNEICEDATFACCEHFADCDAAEALACIYALD